MVERAEFDFGLLCVMYFVFFVVIFLGFFYNDLNRLENGNSWRELTKEKAGICRYL